MSHRRNPGHTGNTGHRRNTGQTRGRASRLIAWIGCLVIRAAVRLQPRSFRDRFGAAIIAETCAEIGAAIPRGAVATATTAFGAIVDAVRGLAGERVAVIRGSSRKDRSMFLGWPTDLRIATRRVTAQPLVTFLVVVTLAFAIGASTVIFSVADAVLLRPLPYPDSDRLVKLDERTASAGGTGVSFPALDIWSREASALESVAFFTPQTSLVMVAGEPDRLVGAIVSRNFMDVLGVAPAVGPGFSPGPLVGSPEEVVISHGLWQRLGGGARVIGTSLQVDPRTYTIVGVMPPGFAYPDATEVWTSPPADMAQLRTARSVGFLKAIGRLRPGTTLEALTAELTVLSERYPATDRLGAAVRMTAEGLRDSIIGHMRRGVSVVAAAAALLLLIAICNVAALLLGRAITRQNEIAVQVALGASAARLARQSALEVFLLAIPGGAAGVAAAWFCRDLIVALSADDIPRISELAIDGRALAFALVATLGGAALATVLPARLSARAAASASLQGSGRDDRLPPGILRTLQGLVIGQVAMTMVMLVGGVLLGRSLATLAQVDTGFTARNVVVMRVNQPLRPRPADAVQVAFAADLHRIAGRLPGVESVAFGSRMPLDTGLPTIETGVVGGGSPVRAVMQAAGPGLFSTIGATIVEGRELAEADAAAPAVVINELLRRQLFGDRQAVGRRVRVRYWTGPVDAEVVGVARPMQYNGLAADVIPEVYLDYRARIQPLLLFARVSGPPEAMIPMLRSAVRQADGTNRVTVDRISTLERDVDRQLARPRFFLALVGTFGAVALVLATAGLYGVMAFAVAQRRHEIGVRLALGASPRQLFIEVAGRGALLTMIGLAVGVGAAAAAGRAMRSLLFGITPWDPLTFGLAAIAVVAVAAAACVIPARRAQATDPLAVLRTS